VVVADPATTRAAVVFADRIELGLSPEVEGYRTMAKGTIFAGARADSSVLRPANPEGFLRRVVAVRQDGARLIVDTETASLTDAIVHGSVRASNGAAQVDAESSMSLQAVRRDRRQALRGIAIDFSDKPLFEGTDYIEIGDKRARFVESVRLDRAVFRAEPVVDIDVQIRDGKVQRFVGKVEGDLDTSVSAAIDVSADGDIDEEVLAELGRRKHSVTRVLYESGRLKLPNFAVAGVPVSPSVRFAVTLRCELAFGGAIAAHAGVEAKSLVRMGAVFDAARGGWGPPIRSDFAIHPSFTMERAGAIDARCSIETDAELSVYGIPGVTMSVAPFVNFNVTEAPSPSTLHHFRVDAGADGRMQGRVNIFGVPDGNLDRKLVEWKGQSVLEGDAP
jgi:hypothetical protein